MKFNGDNGLQGIFGDKVTELFTDKRFEAADVWFISQNNFETINLFRTWFDNQELKISEIINNVIVVTDLEYSEFNEQARKGLTYVIKTNAENEAFPFSRNNMLTGWKALFTSVIGEVMNGSDNNQNIEVLVSQAVFSIIEEIKDFLSNIPQVREAISGFISSKKTELSQKVEDLNNAVNGSEVLSLNEDITELLNEKDESIRSLTESVEQLKAVSANLLKDKKGLEEEKEESLSKISSLSEEILQLKSDLENAKNSEEIDSLKTKNAELEAEVEKLKLDNIDLQANSDLSSEVENLNNKVAEKEALIADFMVEIDKLKSKIDEKNSEIISIKDSYSGNELKEQVKDLLESVAELEKEKKVLEEKVAILEKQLENNGFERDTEFSEMMTKHELEVESFENQIKNLNNDIKFYLDENKKLEQQVANKETEDVIAELETRLSTTTEEYDVKIESLQAELDKVLKEKEELESKVQESNSYEIESLKKENELLQQKFEYISKDAENKAELLSKVGADGNTGQLLDKINKQSEKISEYKAIISEMKAGNRGETKGPHLNIVGTVFGREYSNDELRAEVDKLRKEVADKDMQIKELSGGSATNKELESENKELRKQLDTIEKQLSTLTDKLGQN